MTMEYCVSKKEGERRFSETKHNPGISYSLNVVTKTNRTSNLIDPPIAKEDRFKSYDKGISSSKYKSYKSPLIMMLFFSMVFLDVNKIADASPYIMNNCLLNTQNAIDPSEVSMCQFGHQVDACGTHFCTKGPKGYCGGKFERYGVCGDGLMCNKCNRCTGCSTKTFECWYDDNCIWSSD